MPALDAPRSGDRSVSRVACDPRHGLLERLGAAIEADGSYTASVRRYQTQPPVLSVRVAGAAADRSEVIRAEPSVGGGWWYTGWTGRICPTGDTGAAVCAVRDFLAIRIPATGAVSTAAEPAALRAGVSLSSLEL